MTQMKKKKREILQDTFDAFIRIEAMLELILGKLRKVEDWQIQDRGQFNQKLDLIERRLNNLSTNLTPEPR